MTCSCEGPLKRTQPADAFTRLLWATEPWPDPDLQEQSQNQRMLGWAVTPVTFPQGTPSLTRPHLWVPLLKGWNTTVSIGVCVCVHVRPCLWSLSSHYCPACTPCCRHDERISKLPSYCLPLQDAPGSPCLSSNLAENPSLEDFYELPMWPRWLPPRQQDPEKRSVGVLILQESCRFTHVRPLRLGTIWTRGIVTAAPVASDSHTCGCWDLSDGSSVWQNWLPSCSKFSFRRRRKTLDDSFDSVEIHRPAWVVWAQETGPLSIWQSDS